MIEGIHNFVPEGLRQVKTEYKDFVTINDCYNACPDSMESGMDVLVLTASEKGAGARKVACLADMLELGDASEREHYKVGKMCAEKAVSYTHLDVYKRQGLYCVLYWYGTLYIPIFFKYSVFNFQQITILLCNL